MNNWVELLLIAEHALLKRNSKIIKFFLFQALYGYKSDKNELLEKRSSSEEA